MKKKKNILIIEDEKPLGKILRYKLEVAGFTVHNAANGKEGLEAYANGAYDFILVDLIMPIMDGFTVLEELQKKKNSVPVVVLSNLGQSADIETTKKLGARDFLIKSDTQLNGIVEKVKQIVGE